MKLPPGRFFKKKLKIQESIGFSNEEGADMPVAVE